MRRLAVVTVLACLAVAGSASLATGRLTAGALSATITSSPGGVTQGSDLTITTSVQNTGTTDVTSLTLDVQLPYSSGETLLSNIRLTPTGLSCALGGGSYVHCTAATLASGATASLAVVATAVGSVGAGLSTIAYVFSADGAPVSWSPQASGTAYSFVMAPPSNIAVSESLSPWSVPPGGTTNATVTLSNTGVDRANFWLVFDLGPGAWSLATPAQTAGPTFACSPNTQYSYQCQIGTFAGGASATFRFPIVVGATATVGQILNSRTYAFLNAPYGSALASDARSVVVAAPAPASGGSGGTAAPAPVTLTVTVSGPGTVVGPGIDCPGECAANVPAGTTVELRAVGATGAALDAWSGACSGQSPICSVRLTSSLTVGATFAKIPEARPQKAAVCRVPALVGRTLAKARAVLAANGCKLGAVSRAHSKRAKGLVVSQRAAAGGTHPAGHAVAVVLSLGPR